ncbi:DUF4159 domain-containing protein [Parvularcula oceani]|uniref:DUF4159 domain-containing protein n=1 Tax=Parvularcula oceani TaxID=1247963 RepID=UPI0004E15C9F|nr:DUF4159 domain-containing protein [Parvularcula oceani]
MSALSFASPALLLALLALPLVWWLLRATPPAPAERRFGGMLFLRGLRNEKDTPARTPWPILLLRLVIAGLLIVALAGPMIGAPAQTGQRGPLLIVLDDDWTAASEWRARQDAVSLEAARPGAGTREAWLLRTASDEPVVEGPMTLDDAARRVAGLVPQPRLPDHDAAARALRAAALPETQVLWLAGGAAPATAGRRAFLDSLSRQGFVTAFRLPGAETAALTGLRSEGAALTIELSRIGNRLPAREGDIRVIARDGRTLTRLPFAFGAGEAETEAALDLPLALRNQAAILRMEGERSAGATWLVDASARRVRAGLVTEGATDSLLTSGTYLTQALAPLAVIERGTPEDLVAAGADLIVLDDVGTLRTEAERALMGWLEGGGLLVRFAGPDVANADTEDAPTFPAPLRTGGRSFGGALTWETPQDLEGFDRDSPLGSLSVPEDVEVRRQVLLRGGAEAESWAYLTDGTPLITARRVGEGLIVLFHVTASPTWSDLPLSGAFPAILRRIVALAGTSVVEEASPDRPLGALRLLDGFGALEEPAASTPPATPAAIAQGRAAPGFYGLAEAPLSVNAWTGTPALAPATRGLPAGFAIAGPEGSQLARLGPPLLAVALFLLLADACAMAWLRRRGMGGLAAAMLALALLPDARAQDLRPPLSGKALQAAAETRFAYVETGDPSTDRISRAGLFGLTREAIRRSALEPAQPIGVDLETDDLSVYPLLYWPITPSMREPSDAALSELEAYMAGGGMVIMDTQDGERAGTGAETPQQARLRSILERMDTPPLEPLPDDHILKLSFYRLDALHGRNTEGTVWVEAASALRETTDAVPSLVISGRDWASAWAVDEGGVPLRPAGAGGPSRREAAYRSGINMAMVALTGSYKGDQIHVQELLDRLGEEAP